MDRTVRALVPRMRRYMCRNAAVLDKQSVYTETVIEADASFGGCPGGERGCSAYGACNPVDDGGESWKCRPTNNYMGVANVTDRCALPAGLVAAAP